MYSAVRLCAFFFFLKWWFVGSIPRSVTSLSLSSWLDFQYNFDFPLAKLTLNLSRELLLAENMHFRLLNVVSYCAILTDDDCVS